MKLEMILKFPRFPIIAGKNNLLVQIINHKAGKKEFREWKKMSKLLLFRAH